MRGPRTVVVLAVSLSAVAWAQGALPDQTGVPPGMVKIQDAPASPGPAYEALVKEMAAAAERGDWKTALAKADAALAISPASMAPLSTAAQACCKLKDAKKANAYAARLKGVWKDVAGDLCVKDGITLDGWAPMPQTPKHGYALLEDEMTAAFKRGDWKTAVAKADEALDHRSYEPLPYVIGAQAACKLKDAKAANSFAAGLAGDSVQTVRAACAKDGIKLDVPQPKR